MVIFDCRGLEPFDFSPRTGFTCKGVESGTEFKDVNLSDKEWTEYDEKAQKPVGIYEVSHNFVKA